MQWLDAGRQQLITGPNVGLNQCRHMASLGHNGLEVSNDIE